MFDHSRDHVRNEEIPSAADRRGRSPRSLGHKVSLAVLCAALIWCTTAAIPRAQAEHVRWQTADTVTTTTEAPTTTTEPPTTEPPPPTTTPRHRTPRLPQPAPDSTPVVDTILAVFGTDGQSAVNVAQCESSLIPTAVNHGHYGLFQIASIHQSFVESLGYSWSDILTVYVNVHVAFALYQSSGGWGPWSCAWAAAS